MTFDERRVAARREGAVLAEFDDIGDAAFFGEYGIAKTIVFVDSNLLVVQWLGAVGDAKELTSTVARLAADRCCPA